jgi:hypothetical protein
MKIRPVGTTKRMTLPAALIIARLYRRSGKAQPNPDHNAKKKGI